jgi:NADH:ubiquinone oxidoreductase subunit E
VTKKLQMLLKEVLRLVTFQEEILFNKGGRKRNISYCIAEAMNDLNG